MKKIFILFTCIFIFLLTPLSANASSPISTGYTTEGVSYSVYELETSFSDTTIFAVGQTIDVIREFRFAEIVMPPSTRIYTEVYKGVTYTGTLTLSNFYFENGNTIATYTGTLTAIN